MGLDTSHDCWHGAYSAFNRWRKELARVAGLPPLSLMEGYYVPFTQKGSLPTLYHGWQQESERNLEDLDARLPIQWECLKPDPIHKLLNHSDCDGEIAWEDCGPIADSLEKLLPKLPTIEDCGHIGNWRDKTSTFITGLRNAAAAQENVEFY